MNNIRRDYCCSPIHCLPQAYYQGKLMTCVRILMSNHDPIVDEFRKATVWTKKEILAENFLLRKLYNYKSFMYNYIGSFSLK